MVSDDARHTQEQRQKDVTRMGIGVDSMWRRRRCVRKEKWYSARKRDAAAVLDP